MALLAAGRAAAGGARRDGGAGCQRAAARRGRPGGTRLRSRQHAGGALGANGRSRTRPRRPSARRTPRSTSHSRCTFVLGPALAGVVVAVGRRARRTVHRRRLVPDLRRDAARPAPPRRGGRGGLRARAAARRLDGTSTRRPRCARCCSPRPSRSSSSSPADRSRSPTPRPRCTPATAATACSWRTWGVGAVLGSLVFARSVRRPLGAMLSAGTLAVGLAYVGFAAAPSLAVACIAALIGGLGNGVQWPSLISIVQRLTPPAPARPADGGGRIARRPVSRDRPVAGRGARRAQLAADGAFWWSGSARSRRPAHSCASRCERVEPRAGSGAERGRAGPAEKAA